ncbi:MAG TPA: hypothetical protein VL551_35205 [Actinospica sp.]|nr:hypothetical protein [Actinospica sp.]
MKTSHSIRSVRRGARAMLAVAALGAGLVVPGAADACAGAGAGARPTPTYLGSGVTANAISRLQVVGNVGAPGSGAYHAFAYGLRTGKRVDLGTLGGLDSDASAAYDNIVAGWAYTRVPGQSRAFVVTRPGVTRMVDLGTLGGSNSSAGAVNADFVVGWANTAGDDARHAFRYRIGTKRMTDLGTLGGRDSIPNGVDQAAYGSTVVGYSDTAGNTAYHAFATRGRKMIDLGTLGGSNSDATAVDGNVVIGWAETADGSLHAFYDDLRHPRMVDLGTLTGTDSEALAVHGDYIAGWYAFRESRTIPFVYNMRTHTMKDMTAYRGSMTNMITGVGRGVVSGFSSAPGKFVPWVFDVRAGKYIALPSKYVSPAGYPGPTVDVNADNVVAGNGVDGAGVAQAVVWKWK